MRKIRKTLSIIFWLMAVLMVVLTLTMPAIVAAAPGILALLFALVAFMTWPRKREIVYMREPEQVP